MTDKWHNYEWDDVQQCYRCTDPDCDYITDNPNPFVEDYIIYTIARERHMVLNVGQTLELQQEGITTLYTINGPKEFMLVLLHNIQKNEFIPFGRKLRKRYPYYLDLQAMKFLILDVGVNYNFLFDGSINRAIPRSTPTESDRQDLILYIPIESIINGWE